MMGSTDPAGMTEAADQIAGQLRQERIGAVLLRRWLSGPLRAPCARWPMLEERGIASVALRIGPCADGEDPSATRSVDIGTARSGGW